MRLLMLNNEYPPIGGGTATANYYVVREMAKRGIKVDLVTSTPASNRFEMEEVGETVRIFRVPINNKNIHYQTERELLTYIYRGFFFVRTLYRHNEPLYDLCHAWSGLPAGALARLLKWKRQLPYIVGLRGSDVPGYDVRYKRLYPFLKAGLHQIWQNAAALTANSSELRSLALEFRPQDTIEVIPNGVALDRFEQAVLRDKGPNETFRILCVARLVERKGIDDLIKAVDELRHTRQNFKLMLVGRGDKEADFKAQVARLGLTPWIEFQGAVLHYEMAPVYREADLFILPSLNEGMSNSMLEAMAAGLPIVTTYTGGTAEMLRGNGIIIPKKSSSAIAQAIIELWDNYPLRTAMGERSRQIAATLTWERVTEDYLQLYKRTLAKS